MTVTAPVVNALLGAFPLAISALVLVALLEINVEATVELVETVVTFPAAVCVEFCGTRLVDVSFVEFVAVAFVEVVTERLALAAEALILPVTSEGPCALP